jgi:ABC-type amino acid transport substrate-binding protein
MIIDVFRHIGRTVLIITAITYPLTVTSAAGLERIYIGEGVLAQVTDGRIAGPFPDILREAARRIGQDIEIVPIVWARGQKLAQTETGAGAATVTRVPPREELYVWIEDYMPLTLTLFVKKDSTQDPKSLQDLRGMNVGIERGAVADFVLNGMDDHGINVTSVTEPELLAQMLNKDRIEGWLIWDIIGMENFRRLDMIDEVKRTFSYIVGPIYLVTNSTVSEESVSKWRQTLAAMKADGFIQKTLVRYYGHLVAQAVTE